MPDEPRRVPFRPSIYLSLYLPIHLPTYPPLSLSLSVFTRSFSRVWAIGDVILRARRAKESPLQALVAAEDATVLVTGKIRDVTRETSGAFNRGRVHIEGVAYRPPGAEHSRQEAKEEEEELLRLVLDFQNENLVARRVDEVPGKTCSCLWGAS